MTSLTAFFHARLAPFDQVIACEQLRAIHARLGWPLPRRRCVGEEVAEAAGATEAVLWDFEPDEGQLMARWDQSEWNRRPVSAFSDLLAEASYSLGVVAGRTTLSGFNEQIYDDELAGNVSAVQWFQFYGASIAHRWSRDELLAGPFEHVRVFPDGSVALTIGPSPYESSGWPEAAAHLGLRLRPRAGQG